VATGLLFHERAAVAGNSLNDHVLTSSSPDLVEDELVTLARKLGIQGDPVVRQLIGEALVLRGLSEPTIQRINSLLKAGQLPPQASAILKLLGSTVQLRLSEIAMEIGGIRLPYPMTTRRAPLVCDGSAPGPPPSPAAAARSSAIKSASGSSVFHPSRVRTRAFPSGKCLPTDAPDQSRPTLPTPERLTCG